MLLQLLDKAVGFMMESKQFTGTPAEWNQMIASLPGAHFLQTWEWGQIKAAYGWRPLPLVWVDPGGVIQGAAMILERSLEDARLLLNFRIHYIPRGPLLKDWEDSGLRQAVLASLVDFARQRRSIFTKLDPELPLAFGVAGDGDEDLYLPGQEFAGELERAGWHFSHEQIQYRNTIHIDLQGDENSLLDRMKQKTRYNIRLAERKGVMVRLAQQEDLPLLYQMYAVTSVRDGFVIRREEYYQRVWQTFMQAGLAEALIAEVENKPISALVMFRFVDRAWYVYGMSLDEHREKMPAYLLQWEAIRRARRAGCKIYDLWGAPDHFAESDPMWGVYRFKAGLGGRIVRTVGAWDYPVNQLLYRLYTRVIPAVLAVLRRRGRSQNRNVAGM